MDENGYILDVCMPICDNEVPASLTDDDDDCFEILLWQFLQACTMASTPFDMLFGAFHIG